MPLNSTEIANNALAGIGEEPITSMDDNNARAINCKAFYALDRVVVLSKHDWSCAREYAELIQLSEGAAGPIEEGKIAYQLPSGCLVPRDITPWGSKPKWRVMGRHIWVESDTGLDTVGLYYTAETVADSDLSSYVTDLISIRMSARLAVALQQDKKLSKTKFDLFDLMFINYIDIDSNIGSEYRTSDELPENSSFVSDSSELNDYLDGREY